MKKGEVIVRIIIIFMFFLSFLLWVHYYQSTILHLDTNLASDQSTFNINEINMYRQTYGNLNVIF
jgi:heme/copper-type cytochrome/quinol oxidase subunit 1